jgi:hypothetical protein
MNLHISYLPQRVGRDHHVFEALESSPERLRSRFAVGFTSQEPAKLLEKGGGSLAMKGCVWAAVVV